MSQGKEAHKGILQLLVATGRSLGFIHLLWVIFFLTVFLAVLGVDLRMWGMLPRTPEGLIGIGTMHFLHGNLAHLILNSIAIFSVLIPLFYFFHCEFHMPEVIFKICVIGGILLWIVGRPSIHIGSSLIYYGLATYMVFGAMVHEKKGLLLYALFTLSLNSTTFIAGLIPQNSMVSWEGHLCGAIAGFLVAVGEKYRHHTNLPAEEK